jgi:hypothetical protein
LQLIKQNASFNESLLLTKPIPQHFIDTYSLKDFDKDGYEVPAPLERAYYEAQGIKLNYDIQYHIAPVIPWYIDKEDAEVGPVLDHCMLLQRFAFAGEARKQLEDAIFKRPILQKLLAVKPKYGIDFSLDYIDHGIVMEIIHIEQDFDTLEEANKAKEQLEHIIENTNWYKGAHELNSRRAEWENLSSDDQSDYKAQHFGWHRAFDNIKVI